MFIRSITEDITKVKVISELTWGSWDGGQYLKILTDYLHYGLLPNLLILTTINKKRWPKDSNEDK